MGTPDINIHMTIDAKDSVIGRLDKVKALSDMLNKSIPDEMEPHTIQQIAWMIHEEVSEAYGMLYGALPIKSQK